MSAIVQNNTQPDRSMLSQFKMYLELIRFSHTIFALPFAALAASWAWIAPLPYGIDIAEVSSHRFLPKHAVGLLLCMVAARSFAMAVNRLVDAEIDGHNPRTASRHLPAGLLKRGPVTLFAIGCAVVFVFACFLFLPNRIPIVLSVPVLFFLAGYSFAKRFTSGVHFWLGAALGLAPVCVWIALRGQVVQQHAMDISPVVVLAAAVLFWVAGFDIIYACQDAESDRQARLFSLPARWGVATALRTAAICHAAMLVLLLILSFTFPILSLGWLWNLALLAIAGLLLYEHRLVNPNDLTKVNIAFFQLNAIISVTLFIVGSIDAWWR